VGSYLAEAQSALRVAIDRIDGPNDPDQVRAHRWLCEVAAREQVFIQRHMRLDDPAGPDRLPEIEARIEALDTEVQKAQQRVKRRKSGLYRLRYHAEMIGEGKGGDHDWRKVMDAVNEMVGEGVPPSSQEVRDVLLPILDGLPDLDEMPHGFVLALRELDRYLAGRMSPTDAVAPDVPTNEVIEAARLLKGRSLVLIGGSRRPEAHAALKKALALDELLWIEAKEHESIDSFEPSIARPEVVLVILAIRWSSHSFGEVKRFCDRYNKLLVRLPAGYNPNQVAAQILSQCSEQLGVV